MVYIHIYYNEPSKPGLKGWIVFLFYIRCLIGYKIQSPSGFPVFRISNSVSIRISGLQDIKFGLHPDIRSSGYQIQSDTFSKRDIWDKCEIYWVYSMFHHGLQWPLLMYSHSNWKKRQMLPDIPKWLSFCSSILK